MPKKMYRKLKNRNRERITQSHLTSDVAETPIEALDLTVRAFNSLHRTGITTVGDVLDLLEKGDTAVMSIRKFGEKSLDELRDKMVEKGYLRDEMFYEDKVGKDGVITVEESKSNDYREDMIVQISEDYEDKYQELKEIIDKANNKNESEIDNIRKELSQFVENNVKVVLAVAEAQTIKTLRDTIDSLSQTVVVLSSRVKNLEEESERKRHWKFNYLTLILTILASLLGSVITLIGENLLR